MSSPPQSPAAAATPLDPARELEEADAELRKLGYHYNEHDELRSVDAEAAFTFVNQARSRGCCGADALHLGTRVSAFAAGARVMLRGSLRPGNMLRNKLCPKHRARRQAHYERLALGVAAYVQALLLTRCSLQRRLVRGVDVYASADVDAAPSVLVRGPRARRCTPCPLQRLTATRFCLTRLPCGVAPPLLTSGTSVPSHKRACSVPCAQVLLCGAGAVAAGQWARRLCINENLSTGTVIPYVGALAHAHADHK